MYLEHFNLKELPFGLTPNTDFFCTLPGHEEALNVLLVSLRNNEGFIKIVGEVGTGKTLLCRKLLSELEDEFVTAYIPNPDLSPDELRRVFARELGVDFYAVTDSHVLLEQINYRLLELHKEDKRVVLIIDEAQVLSQASFEALRLLTNLETENSKLLQVVLFGQPELDAKLKKPQLRQLQQRITFSYLLQPISRQQLDAYLTHRLAMAGHTKAAIFNKRACDLIFKASQGVPRVINILCHKALIVAYGRGKYEVGPSEVVNAIRDTEGAEIFPAFNKRLLLISGAAIAMLAFAFKYYNLSRA